MRCKNCRQWVVRGWPRRESHTWRHGRTGLYTCDVVAIGWKGDEWPMAVPAVGVMSPQVLPLDGCE